MSTPRTPEQMMHDINNLNCHARGGGYGPVTERQMQDIYAEARKMEWTDKKPDSPGWWVIRDGKKPMPVLLRKASFGLYWITQDRDLRQVNNARTAQWSTRPIDMPDKEDSKL